jgi:hypothetical protein
MVLTLSIFVRQKSLYSKKKPKSARCRLNKLKKRVLKKCLDEILNYRSAGLLSVPVPVRAPGPGPKKVDPAHLYIGLGLLFQELAWKNCIARSCFNVCSISCSQ